MAKAAWCTVAPTSGTGNKSISISAGVHTGRIERSTIATIQNQNGTKPSKAITVNQAAKGLFIDRVLGPTPGNIPAGVSVIVVTGKSNAKSIRIFEDSDCMFAHEFKVNGILQKDIHDDPFLPLFVISGDPGAAAEYTFESKITFPANTDASARTLVVAYRGYLSENEDNDWDDFDFSVIQAGAASTLSTDKNSLSLVNAGTAQNIAITSNDKWVIS